MQSPVSALVVKTMVLVAVWCGLSSTAAAQSALTGIVHDWSGRVVVNAKVLVSDANTGKALPLTWTTALGYYELEVPPGEYRIHVEQDGLTYDGVIRVNPNEKAALDIELNYHYKADLTVPADSPESATTMTGLVSARGGTFTRDTMDSLFLSNGRTVQSMASLVPGVVYTESTGTLAQYTAVGQQRFANRLTVDGISGDLAIDTRGGIGEAGSGVLPAVSTLGGTQTIVPMAAIEEMRIKTTDVTPQDARAPGAQVIVITRSGTDRFRGDGFLDWRPQRLGANDWFATAPADPDTGEGYRKQPTSSQNGGLSAGGPIIREQLHYFAAWEQQRITRPLTATFQVPSMSAREAASDTVKPLLAAFPAPNVPGDPTDDLGSYSGNYAATSDLSSVSLKLDATLSNNHRLFGRINVGKSSGEWVNSFQQLPNLAFSRVESATTRTATVGLSSTRSALANELRVNVSTSHGGNTARPLSGGETAPLPLDLLLPSAESRPLAQTGDSFVNLTVNQFVLAGVAQAGRNVDNMQTQVQFVDTVAVSSARHDWRFGVDGRWSFASARPTTAYSYRFGDITQGQLISVTAVDAVPARAMFSNISVFAEDTFRVSKRFSLSYGLRYGVEPAPSIRDDTAPYLLDVATLPKPTQLTDRTSLWNTSWGSVAPRVAAAYQFGTGTDHETTFRGGWGLAFDSLSRFAGDALSNAYPYTTIRLLLRPPYPLTPAVWANLPDPKNFEPGDSSLYYAFPKDFRVPRTYSWQAALDQALGRTQRLSVAYAGAAGGEQPYRYFYNPGNAHVYAYSNDGRSDYNALLAEYAWRPWRGLQVRANYTLSHAIDLDSGEEALPNLPPSVIEPASNRGSADFDRRHVFLATASYQLPSFGGRGFLGVLGADWQMDAMVVVRSGAPVTVTSQRQIGSGFGNYPLRADVVSGVPVWIPDATAPEGRVLNADAFAAPATATQQGTLGRNTLQAFPLRQLDLSVSRPIRLGQRVIARLRIDAFNVLNLANFAAPVSEATDTSAFGKPRQSYAAALGTGTLTGGGLVPIQQVGGPRSLQVGVQFSF